MNCATKPAEQAVEQQASRTDDSIQDMVLQMDACAKIILSHTTDELLLMYPGSQKQQLAPGFEHYILNMPYSPSVSVEKDTVTEVIFSLATFQFQASIIQEIRSELIMLYDMPYYTSYFLTEFRPSDPLISRITLAFLHTDEHVQYLCYLSYDGAKYRSFNY